MVASRAASANSPKAKLRSPKTGEKIRVYKRGKLTYPDGRGGTEVADVSDRTGSATCKSKSGR